jgi:hypothetical protein
VKANAALKDSILEIQVNAALTGHDLGPFEPVEVLEVGKTREMRSLAQGC